MAETFYFTVTSDSEGKRLDQFLNESFPEKSRSYFTKRIKDKQVVVNGSFEKSGYKLHLNDKIEAIIPEEKSDLEPARIDLDIVYEDNAVLVVNKPAGLTVHPGKGTQSDTLVNAVLYHLSEGTLPGESDRPGIVHRLDKFTSGLIVVAKTEQALLHLRRQFDEKTIRRIYSALVWGQFEEKEGRVETYLRRSRSDPTKFSVGRESGKKAVTNYIVIDDFIYASHLQLELETGRTHQIRVHMNHIHHPVIGDRDYHGRETQLKQLPPNLQRRGQSLLKILPHQALHARALSFIHPAGGEKVAFEAPLPRDMQKALDKLPDLFMLRE